jgi:hypothetical protein
LIAQVPKTYFVSYMCVYMSGFLPIDRERERENISSRAMILVLLLGCRRTSSY